MIPVRSKRQAMDWSLVLLSQGIEAVILPATEDHGWQLAVPPADLARAVQSLRAYREENRHPIWHQPLPWKGLVFDWRSVIWFALLIFIFFLGPDREVAWRELAVMDSQAVAEGQWWRLFTAITLHADAPHLLANTATGVLFLGLAMGAFGSGYGLLGAYLAGAGANLVGLLLYPASHRGLGASGMVMGALGLLVAQSFALVRAGLSPTQFAVRSLVAGFLLLVLLGFNPHSDVVAHVAGFVLGCSLGLLLILLPGEPSQNDLANRFCEVVCAGLVVGTWGLALRGLSG